MSKEAIDNYQHGFKYVCSYGDLETLKLMLQSFEGENFDRIINARYIGHIQYTGHIGFIEACTQGKDEIVKLLLDHPLCKDKVIGDDDFLHASQHGKHSVVKYMVNTDFFSEETIISFLTTRKEDGRTGFMLACRENHQEVVKVMLECPVSRKLILEKSLDLNFVNFKDNTGKTGFMYACMPKKTGKNLINFLLDHELFSDADISDFIMTKDNYGNDSIILTNSSIIREKLQDVIVKYLKNQEDQAN